ncbi:uncharacterized protein LOC119689185 [Teleopsis dalmanni]|uniref:uncharacterized protein LOC119689185 n=1 Tax=Teleopsis dalmanni TaxID=139649 RepID=UPI0018CC8A6A|nr:uncharacterized protein LOC119689185 [Teleopsis dalmanni]
MNSSQRLYGNLCSNAFKTKKIDPKSLKSIKEANLAQKLAHRLRVAILEGGSVSFKQNSSLKESVQTALNNGMRMKNISKIIENFANPLDPLRTHILQVRLGRKICAILTVNCGSLKQIKYILQPLLKQFNGTFTTVLPYFNYTNDIEAIISYRVVARFGDLESKLFHDGLACKAKKVEVVDYQTGAVNFKCYPRELNTTCHSIKKKGYTILHFECNFVPKSPVRLTSSENEFYYKFLSILLKDPHVLKVYDNVLG